MSAYLAQDWISDMAINQLQLPGAIPSSQFDFGTPLARIGEAYQESRARDALSSLQRRPDGSLDTTPLLNSGNVNLAQIGLNYENQRAAQLRQAAQDARQRERDAVTDRQNSAYLSIAQRAADRADTTDEEKASEREKVLIARGIDPNSTFGRRFTLTGQIANDSGDLIAQVNQRKSVAENLGLKPDHPAYSSYVASGKFPREDQQPLSAGDKEAIRTADDQIIANRAAIQSLQRAKELSKQAFSGPFAEQRGYAASFLGEGSDIGKAGIATANLTNETISNALSQLKTIFGGNPTEGERKILLDLQGSVSLPDAVRQAIFDRAIAAAQVRLEENQKRADALRGNTYYKPQQQQQARPQSSGPITQEQYNSLPSGSRFTAPDGTERIKP